MCSGGHTPNWVQGVDFGINTHTQIMGRQKGEKRYMRKMCQLGTKRLEELKQMREALPEYIEQKWMGIQKTEENRRGNKIATETSSGTGKEKESENGVKGEDILSWKHPLATIQIYGGNAVSTKPETQTNAKQTQEWKEK